VVDVEHILARTAPLWRELAGARLFITGGTGFWGVWLLEAIAAANDELGVAVRATVLSRQQARFAAEMPRLAKRPEFDWLIGDAASFAFPAGRHDFVCHFATAPATALASSGPALAMTTLAGTQRVLHFARHCCARRLLLASSGAVYGAGADKLSPLAEDCRSAPNTLAASSAYAEIKRMSELMCALTPEVDCVIARGFSFVGPHLPLTDKFAVGSFIRDALAGGPIRIRGDGRPLRSYLYAADLLIWLLTILMRGRPNWPYNVGSDEAVSVGQLASEVAAAAGGVPLDIAGLADVGPAASYVPHIGRARRELGLRVWIGRQEAIARTLAWRR
jgi:nucleoside-diphosphate-sugar epimerase